MNDSSPKTPFTLATGELRLGNSYLLLGAEAYLADKALEAIRTTLKSNFEADTTIVYADDTKPAVLAEHLDAFSIFSTAKLVVVRNADKLGKNELEVLTDYFNAPSDIQSIVVIAEKIDARLSEEFISRIDLDYYYAANELSKLDLLSADRNQITEADVLRSLGTTRMGSLIDFYRALGKKSLKQTLETLQLMIAADWEALQVLFQLNKFYAVIWRILLLKKAHLSDSEIIAKHLMDLFQTQRKEFLDFAKSYTLNSVESIFRVLLDTDSQYKLSVADSNILLSRCLIEVLNA
jgi:DNA polymerase III delta subunit